MEQTQNQQQAHQDPVMNKKLVQQLIKKGILVTPEILTRITNKDPLLIEEYGLEVQQEPQLSPLSPSQVQKSKEEPQLSSISVQQIPNNQQNNQISSVSSLSSADSHVSISSSYDANDKKREVKDFVAYFTARLKAIKSMLVNRQELQDLTSINRLVHKEDRARAAIIGLVTEKKETANKNIMLTLEDQTGSIKVLINQSKGDLYRKGKEIVLDEVLGVVGVCGKNILFADAVIQPDIPLYNEMKKCPDDVCAVFLSDIHVGSDNFLPDEFNKFLSWIKKEAGSDAQKELAAKVKYVFIAGDLIDGVGIYPGQEKELLIPDIYDQYTECAKLISQIPKHIKIIISPGNHDGGRLSEPQLKLRDTYAKPFWELENVILVNNPALINIHACNGFPGFEVLMYHGYSFDYYVANVDAIREGGGYDRADLVMKFLLQRRHLAPAHTSTLYIPDPDKDCLVIDKVPDFFVTGHIHKSTVANYRNITMICGSCWQAKTAFQEKVGHHPEPCRVPVVNLKTRQVKMLRFDKQEEKSEENK